MNEKKKQQPTDPEDPAPDLEDLGVVVDDLPPLDGDAVDEADPAVLADYLSEVEETVTEAGDEEGVVDEASEAETGAELEHLESESWFDGGGDERQVDLDVEVEQEEEETGWSDAGSDETLSLEDDWFEEDAGSSAVDDGGQEGPLDDELAEIDSSTWDDLGEGLDDDELEPVEEVMDRLGIAFPEERGRDRAGAAAPRVDRGVVLERQFLGPLDERIEAVAVAGGAVVGAGDGIFVLGADGMLHRREEELPGFASSVCVHGPLTFVGTDASGAFRLEPGKSAAPINGWNAVWIGERAVVGRVTTSFSVAGQAVGDRFRLVGLTGEGQLFASGDLGQSWTGPLSRGKCLAAAVVEGTDRVIALVTGGSTGSRLVASQDLRIWHELATPELLAAVSQPGAVRLAAVQGTLLAASGSDATSLQCSFDGGASWRAIHRLTGVTAVAVDPDQPDRIAAAAYDSERDLGTVHVSDDQGRSWKIAAIAGKEQLAGSRPEGDGPLGRVTCLVIDVGRARRLYVVAGEGAHQIVLSRGGLTQ